MNRRQFKDPLTSSCQKITQKKNKTANIKVTVTIHHLYPFTDCLLSQIMLYATHQNNNILTFLVSSCIFCNLVLTDHSSFSHVEFTPNDESHTNSMICVFACYFLVFRHFNPENHLMSPFTNNKNIFHLAKA